MKNVKKHVMKKIKM